jgi:hypothetical protein
MQKTFPVTDQSCARQWLLINQMAISEYNKQKHYVRQIPVRDYTSQGTRASRSVRLLLNRQTAFCNPARVVQICLSLDSVPATMYSDA